MLARQIELNTLVEKIANTLGVTVDEISKSERFEQTVYDMAKTTAKFPDIDFSGKAQFGFDHGNRIKITYKSSIVSTEELANFYNKYFPETVPHYVYGMTDQCITFLTEPFVQKVLPTMKLWRLRPSCIADSNLHYIDNSKMLLQSSLKPELGNAVFITGADPQLGEWKTASRLNFNNTSQGWEFTLPVGLKDHEFKFLTGRFDLGEKISPSQLTVEDGSNRTLIIHAPINRDTPLQAVPEGIGMRC